MSDFLSGILLCFRKLIVVVSCLFISPWAFSQVEICGNGLDDDNDGLIDCYDVDCNGSLSCQNSFVNNSASCQYSPGTATFGMQTQWQTAKANYGIFSTLTPIAGDWDNDGIVEIFAYKHNGLTGSSAGPSNVIYVIDGNGGLVEDSIIMSNNALGLQTSGMAIADLDNDLFGELIVINTSRSIVCYEHTGALKWTSPALPLPLNPFLNIADFNQDGHAEVYCSNQIFNGQTGTFIGSGPNPPTGALGAPVTSGQLISFGVSMAADVLPTAFCADCAGLELIAGHQVYSVNIGTGTLTIQNAAFNSAAGFTALADYDNDGDLDAIVATDAASPGQNFIYVWDIQTSTVMATSPLLSSSNWFIGPPSVGDLDGDGRLEVCVVTKDTLRVLDDYLTGMTGVWSKQVIDSSGYTGMALFDFQGDGQLEIVYQDEDALMVLNGSTGNTLASSSCLSATNMTRPIIADVDRDGQAEIICGCSDSAGTFNRLHGYISTFKAQGEAWVGARSVWNQPSYMVTNINDDLSIPLVQQAPQIVSGNGVLNAFNMQSAILTVAGTPAFGAPDATISFTTFDLSNCGLPPNTIGVGMKIFNLSTDASIPGGTPVALYNGNPNLGGATLIDTFQTPNMVLPLDSVSTMLTIPDQGGTFDLYAVVNDTGFASTPISFPSSGTGECNFLNNTIDQSIVACSLVVNTPLPVNYSALYLYKKESTNVLKWGTTYESNCSHFNIERSVDGENFKPLGKVLSKSLNGLSNELLSYNFIDHKPLTGYSYYRLVQVDRDNHSSFSKVIQVFRELDGGHINIYPNPLRDHLKVDILSNRSAQMEIKLTDMSGCLIKRTTVSIVKGANHIALKLKDLAAGIYGLQIFENGQLVHILRIHKVD